MKKILLLLLSISFTVSIKAQSMLCTYEGGYFIQNGNTWYEYRPHDKDGIWNTYSQYSSDENYFFIRNKSNNISIPKKNNNSIWILRNNKWEVQYRTINVYNYCPVKGAKLFTYKDGFFIKTDNSWQEYTPLKKQNGAFDSFAQNGIDDNFYYIKNNRISLAIPRNTSNDFFWKKDGKWVKLYTAETVYDNSSPTSRSSSNSSNQTVADNNSSNTSQIPMYIDCAYCNGTGKYMCTLCAGAGWRMQSNFIMYVGYVTNKVTCELCNGTGKSNTCIYCNSTGKRVNPDHPYARGGNAGSSYNNGESSSSSSSSRSSRSTSNSTCSKCHGTGVDPAPSSGGNRTSWVAYYNATDNVCPHCYGVYEHWHTKCSSCNIPRW